MSSRGDQAHSTSTCRLPSKGAAVRLVADLFDPAVVEHRPDARPALNLGDEIVDFFVASFLLQHQLDAALLLIKRNATSVLAVEDAGLAPALVAEVKCLKLRAFRRAIAGITAALATAFAGAYATDHAAWVKPHLAAALLSLGVQAVAFAGEYRVISANGLLMDRVFGEHDRQSRLRGAAGAKSAS